MIITNGGGRGKATRRVTGSDLRGLEAPAEEKIMRRLFLVSEDQSRRNAGRSAASAGSGSSTSCGEIRSPRSEVGRQSVTVWMPPFAGPAREVQIPSKINETIEPTARA
jgi:hypothetical protein